MMNSARRLTDSLSRLFCELPGGLSRSFALVIALVLGLAGQGYAAEQVAVAVFASEAGSSKYERVLQARLESLLDEAGLTVLDEAKAKKMKTGWVDLADPGHLVTAEEFLKNAGKYDVSKVYKVSFNSGVNSTLGLFYTASAAVQVRVIDKDARVKAGASLPMGVKGFPPSDGLTADAAIVNALQRALDSAAQEAGIPVLAPTLPRAIPLTLELAATAPAGLTELKVAAPAVGDQWKESAVLLAETWKKESPGCAAVSSDGQLGVLGGYMSEFLRFDKIRNYGGRLHLIDIAQKKEINTFTLHELGKRASGENGTSEPLACTFLGSWRHLVAITGNKLSCYDVERGTESCSLQVAGAPDKASFSLWQAGSDSYLKVLADGAVSYYKIVKKTA